MYIHQRPDWPRFSSDLKALAEPLAAVSREQGRLIGHMEALGFPQRQNAVLETLTSDVLKSSEIEGERFDPEQVRSSVARRLGIDIGALRASDRYVDGVVDMVLDATTRYHQPLTADRLWSWHAALFPTGRSGLTKITTGAWRQNESEPMQVVSGRGRRARVHFEAPESARVSAEMARFLEWFESKDAIDGVLHAGLAHFWFVTIHPFEDGNGRIARAIADMALARSESSSQRFYSMSAQIRQERDEYYSMLEQTQKGTLDITPWLSWFIACLGRAIANSRATLGDVMKRAAFWERARNVPLNDRQRRLLTRLLEGFEGKLTTSKYAKLADCSQDSALRDIDRLLDAGLLERNEGGGRSTAYSVAIVAEDS